MRLYHNPRCSKSRQALALLEEREIEFEDYRYLERGIDPKDIELLLDLNGIIRTNEDEYKNSGVDLNDRNELKALMLAHPRVVERPILIHNGKAIIGRPPEEILAIIQNF